MPEYAASPGWSCLVEAPVARNSRSPPAWLPAMPRASTVRRSSSRISRAATRAAAKTPQAMVAWSPRAWNACGAAAAIRQTVS